MQTVILAHETDFDGWRAEARRLCGQGVRPEMISWQVEGKG
ncbi:MAG TPA: uracil-DNA glycosylase, partial [Hyphomonadaceae bacterium]|nr:uracil-DNA glycosylase [Hyphomonadaceae bacterium]